VKRFSLLIVLTLISLCVITRPVSAHVLKSDRDIGAILHIDPDDSPVSGRPTTYILYFSDVSNRFTLPKCTCTVSVKENGQTIASQSLARTSLLTSTNVFTFPKADVYTLAISGKAITLGSFQSFSLNYLVRVESGTITQQPFPRSLWIGLGLTIALLLLGAYTMEENYGNKS
jgi:hypothetical protein